MQALGVVRKPRLRQLQEPGRELEAPGLDLDLPLADPGEQTLEQVAVGAADVEEGARVADTVRERAAQPPPVLLRPEVAGLPPGLVPS